MIDLSLDSKRVTKWLVTCITGLAVAHVGAMLVYYGLEPEVPNRLADLYARSICLFDLSEESNLPTFYATSTLLVCSALLLLIARLTPPASENRPLHWSGLSAIFAFLAADEFTQLHETLTVPFRVTLQTEGLLYYAWILPYGVALAALALIYSGFLKRLPPGTRNRFVLAGVVFVTGAVGFEALGGREDAANGWDTLAYLAYSTLEELLEMIGVAIFLVALVQYLESIRGSVELHFTPSGPGGVAGDGE